MQPAIEGEVRHTLAAYCHTVDDGRFDDFARLWAPDAVLAALGDDVRGAEAIRDWMERAMPAEKRGKHVTVNTIVALESADRVTAISDFLFLSPDGGSGWRVTVAGRYLDELIPAADGTWVFASRRIEIAGR